MANKKNRQKTFGILGGMGVYATLDFLTQVFNFSPSRETFGNLKIIIDNAISIPNIIRAALFKGPDPKRGIIKSIEDCEKIGAEFIAVPCNSVHYYPSIMENDTIINAIEEIALTSTLQEHSRELVRKIIFQYKEKVDSVILACTELSIVFKNKYMLGLPVIDSNVEYAKEVVKLSFGDSRL